LEARQAGSSEVGEGDRLVVEIDMLDEWWGKLTGCGLSKGFGSGLAQG